MALLSGDSYFQNMANPPNTSILKGNKTYRNQILSLYLGLIFILYLIWNFLWPRLFLSFQLLPVRRSFTIAEITCIVFLISFLFPAAYLIRLGSKISRSGQYPFPGMRLMFDTKVIVGLKAMRYGRSFQFLGWLSVCMAVLGSVWVHFVFEHIRHSPWTGNLPLFI